MRPKFLPLVAGGLLVAACSGATPAAPSWSFPPAPSQTAVAEARVVTVYRSPSCTCCHEWEAYMANHGFTVRSMSVDDMAAVKLEHGVPLDASSCHTAVVDGYVIEGHVPAEAVEALLAERPAIDGIALPGMPTGSPGMPGEPAGPLEVLAIADGTTSSFGTY